MSEQVKSWTWMAALVCATAYCAHSTWVSWNEAEHFRSNAVTAKAVVTESWLGVAGHYDPRDGSDAGEPSQSNYRFTTADGREFEGSDQTYVEPGTIIEIEYLPTDPHRNLIKGSDLRHRYRTDLGLALISAGALAVFLHLHFKR